MSMTDTHILKYAINVLVILIYFYYYVDCLLLSDNFVFYFIRFANLSVGNSSDSSAALATNFVNQNVNSSQPIYMNQHFGASYTDNSAVSWCSKENKGLTVLLGDKECFGKFIECMI